MNKFHCNECSDEFCPPVFQCPCGKSICKSCTRRLPWKDARVCSSCKNVLPEAKIRNVVMEKKIVPGHLSPCTFAHKGCNSMVIRSKMDKHLQSCSFGLVPCKFRPCKVRVRPSNLEKHEKRCPYKGSLMPTNVAVSHRQGRIQCIYGCQAWLKCSNIEMHKKSCPTAYGTEYVGRERSRPHQREPEPCPFANKGCPAYIKKTQLSRHYYICLFNLVACPFTADGCLVLATPAKIEKHKNRCFFAPERHAAVVDNTATVPANVSLIRCDYSDVGCTALMKPRNKDKHMGRCQYAVLKNKVFTCPLKNCSHSHTGHSLPSWVLHASRVHKIKVVNAKLGQQVELFGQPIEGELETIKKIEETNVAIILEGQGCPNVFLLKAKVMSGLRMAWTVMRVEGRRKYSSSQRFVATIATSLNENASTTWQGPVPQESEAPEVIDGNNCFSIPCQNILAKPMWKISVTMSKTPFLAVQKSNRHFSVWGRVSDETRQ